MILNGKFDQKTAIVTGAGSGIGREVALGRARAALTRISSHFGGDAS